MNVQPHAWLPQDAIAPERIQPAIDELMAEWGRAWLAESRPTLKPAFQDDWLSTSTSANWRSCADVASLELTPTVQAVIAGAMLGVTVPSGSLQAAERTIVEDVARAAADDLLVRFARLTGLKAEACELSDQAIDLSRCSWWSVGLGVGRRGFKFALSDVALMTISKQALAPARRSRSVSLREALALHQIRVSATLGHCALSLADLKGLAVGDVVVLDRAVESPLEIHVDGRPSVLRASLQAEHGKATLALL
jgi:hypothetical protein